MLWRWAMHKDGLAKSRLSAFLYRFRGYILGFLALVLVAFPPSLFPQQFCINDCWAGIIIAIPLFIASACLRIRTRQFIGEHTRGKIHDADKLVTVGVYSRVRHPLYISNTGFAVGFIFFHLGVSLWTIPFILVVVLFEVVLAQNENRFLEQKFGETWRAWARKTPNFFPHIFHCCSSCANPSGSPSTLTSISPQRSFWQAFSADRWTWLWLLFCNLVLVIRKVMVFYD